MTDRIAEIHKEEQVQLQGSEGLPLLCRLQAELSRLFDTSAPRDIAPERGRPQGNTLHHAGKAPPPSGRGFGTTTSQTSPPPKAPTHSAASRVEADKAQRALEAYLAGHSIDVEWRYFSDIRKAQVRFKDRRTGRVILNMPYDEVINHFLKMAELEGIILRCRG
ncbi:MAG: hypothetical protein K9L28_03310 [Synergistales bacterium]|nr:hypothetical protein [Synergistales bacterium]